MEGCYSCHATIPLVLAGVALFGCPGGEVFGPVASRVADPPDSCVDVHAEEIGQDCGGQIGGQGGEGSVTGGADVDAMTAESGGQGVIGDRLAGHQAWKQPARRVVAGWEFEPSLRLGFDSQPREKRCEPWWQQDRT